MTPSQQPSLSELLSRFLTRQAQDRAAGIGELPASEVEPYEAAFVPVVEPRAAWDEASAALRMLAPSESDWKAVPPADWTAIAASPDGALAVPLAAGNFPQLVKDLPLLVREKKRSNLQSVRRAELPAAGLTKWVDRAIRDRAVPQMLMGAGVLRLSRHIEEARAVLLQARASVGGAWQHALTNEEAALHWECGNTDEALRLWQNLPDSAPACFNRGMALLFLDRPAEARLQLQKAVELIPEDNAWHHLARLYLTLTEM